MPKKDGTPTAKEVKALREKGRTLYRLRRAVAEGLERIAELERDPQADRIRTLADLHARRAARMAAVGKRARYRWLLAALAVLLFLCALPFYLIQEHRGVTRANCARIKPGMTW